MVSSIVLCFFSRLSRAIMLLSHHFSANEKIDFISIAYRGLFFSSSCSLLFHFFIYLKKQSLSAFKKVPFLIVISR